MSFLCCGKKVLKYLQHNTLDVTIMLAEKGNSCQSHSYKNESNFLEYRKIWFDLHRQAWLPRMPSCIFSLCSVSLVLTFYTCGNILWLDRDQKEDLYCSLLPLKSLSHHVKSCRWQVIKLFWPQNNKVLNNLNGVRRRLKGRRTCEYHYMIPYGDFYCISWHCL